MFCRLQQLQFMVSQTQTDCSVTELNETTVKKCSAQRCAQCLHDCVYLRRCEARLYIAMQLVHSAQPIACNVGHTLSRHVLQATRRLLNRRRNERQTVVLEGSVRITLAHIMWNPEFWLPRGVTWDQLPTHFEDLIYPIMLTFPILVFRILFESFVGIPCGFYLGYGTGTLTEQIKRHLFFGFASNTRSKRVLECFFRFSSYLFLFLFGCITLVDAPWLHDVTLCWIGYPFHEVSDAVW